MVMSKNSTQEQYISKIHMIQDYIEDHLDEELTIELLADIANFSPFYFHRLFKQIVNERLYSYIQRQRLEKAGFLLVANTEMAVSEIALSVGFSNQASFAKAFKKYYGVTATEYRKSKNGQTENKHGKVKDSNLRYNHHEAYLDGTEKSDLIKPQEIKICNHVDKEVIYVRHTGYYKGDSDLFAELFNKLYKWAFARDLINKDTEWIVIYHDNNDSTEDDKLRMSVCMTISSQIKVDKEIGKRIISGGKYAVGRFELFEAEYQMAWNYMMLEWLPHSGFKPDDRLAYELYPTNIESDVKDKRVVDIYIPIVPL